MSPTRLPLLPLQTEKFSGIAEVVLPPAVVSSSPKEQMEAGHESMKIVLTSPTDVPARRSRASQGRGGMAEELEAFPAGWEWLCEHPHCPHAGTGHGTPTQGSPAQEDVPSSPDDASDEIMDQLVKSVTHNANPRPCPKERRRSRGNRKSCKSHLCPCALFQCSVPVLCPISMSLSHLFVPAQMLFPSSVSLSLTLSHLFVAMPCPISLSLRLCPVSTPLLISV